MTGALGWRWAFFLNVPVGVATTALAVRVLARETGPGLRRGAGLRPLVPSRLLRRRVVVINLAHALLVGAMFGFQFLVTLYFQRVLGYTPAEAGLGILPVALGIGALSLGAFPRLAARFGAQRLLPPALALIAAGLLLLARVPVDGDYATTSCPASCCSRSAAGWRCPR